MEITCDTPLTQLVISKNIVNAFNSATDGLKNDCSLPRLNSIKTEIEKSAIKNSKVAGSGDMYAAGVNVASAYEAFHTALVSLQETVSTASVNQEIMELNDIISKLTVKINQVTDDVRYYQRLKDNEEDESKKDDYRSKIRNLQRYLEAYDKKKETSATKIKQFRCRIYCTNSAFC